MTNRKLVSCSMWLLLIISACLVRASHSSNHHRQQIIAVERDNTTISTSAGTRIVLPLVRKTALEREERNKGLVRFLDKHHNRLRLQHDAEQGAFGGDNSTHGNRRKSFGDEMRFRSRGQPRNRHYLHAMALVPPPQYFTVLFDTTIPTIWINSDYCTDDTCKRKHGYEWKNSTTFRRTGVDMRMATVFGKMGGIVGQDTFRLGALLVKHQGFVMVVEQKNDPFGGSKFDGIVGLSFAALGVATYTPLFDNIMASAGLVRNMINFHYDERQGSVSLGHPDPYMYYPPMIFIKVSRKNYWEVELKDIEVGDKSFRRLGISLCPGSGPTSSCGIAINTGTQLFLGPSRPVAKILDMIAADRCSELHRAPVITFTLADMRGEYRFTVEPEHYVVTHGYVPDLLTGYGTDDAFRCRPGFGALDVPPPWGPIWSLGGLFIQKYFISLDKDSGSVGFALARHTNAPLGPASMFEYVRPKRHDGIF